MNDRTPRREANEAFANGTEGHSWMDAWCSYCVHDHDMHNGGDGGGCAIIVSSMVPGKPWPEPWIEPVEWVPTLPPTLACLKFAECECVQHPGAAEVRRVTLLACGVSS